MGGGGGGEGLGCVTISKCVKTELQCTELCTCSCEI